MEKKRVSAAEAKALEKVRKEELDEQRTRDAVDESARVRAMFEEDRKERARRYGVATLS
ncbi:MAG: hypothetical protein ABR591_14910 [Candidatus Velthaea sp.]